MMAVLFILIKSDHKKQKEIKCLVAEDIHLLLVRPDVLYTDKWWMSFTSVGGWA